LAPNTLIGQVTPVSHILSIAQDNNPTKTNETDLSQDESSYRQRRYGTYDGRRQQGEERQTSQIGETGDRTFYSHITSFVNNNYRHRQNNRNNTHNIENPHHGSGHNHSDSLSSEPLISSIPSVKHTFEELKIKLTNPAITPEQETKFRSLIDEFGDVFAVSNTELPGMDRLKFKINVHQDSRPFCQRPYSYSKEARAQIERQIQEMLAIKFIRHSISPWASNVLLVRKTNGEQRFCLDCRGLNKCVIPEIHSVPPFSNIYDTLSYEKPVIFSTLDLGASFQSLVVEEESINYTAFQSHLGQFEFCRAPFGLRTVSSHLIRAVSLILAEKEGPLMKRALAYVDDVLCYCQGTL